MSTDFAILMDHFLYVAGVLKMELEMLKMSKNKYRAWVKDKQIMITDTQDFIPLKATSAGVLRLSATHAENLYSLLPIDNFVLMQCTGLKDKNGKDIYEGDILNSKNDGSDGCDVWDYDDFKNLVVEWNEKYCSFIGMPDIDEDSVYDISRIEILGNIYENPELLKQ